MIYLKNTTEAQVMFIPRNGEVMSGALELCLGNTTDHVGMEVEVSDICTSALYFDVAVVLPEGIATGEYHYELKDGEIVVSSGLVFIGDLQNPNQYEKTITYRQYESE